MKTKIVGVVYFLLLSSFLSVPQNIINNKGDCSIECGEFDQGFLPAIDLELENEVEESRRDFRGLTNNFGDNKFGTCGYTIYRSVLALDIYSSHKCSNNYIKW